MKFWLCAVGFIALSSYSSLAKFYAPSPFASGSLNPRPVSLTVNGKGAAIYQDLTFATTQSVSLVNGANSLTNIFTRQAGGNVTNISSFTLPTSIAPTYDDNENMLSDGQRAYTYYEDEALASISVASGWKTEFVYDGKFRRRIERDYGWNGSSWTLTNEVRLIYDGNVILQHRDAINLPTLTLTRGRDLSGSLQGAGGIGGLLARTDHTWPVPALAISYYHADGAGNVTALVNTNGLLVARYAYDPYGNTLGQDGPLADANRYRFSSKEFHKASGLVYYGFRFYDPSLQRWLNADPLGERGGINLYQSFFNSPLNFSDRNGLDNIYHPTAGQNAIPDIVASMDLSTGGVNANYTGGYDPLFMIGDMALMGGPSQLAEQPLGPLHGLAEASAVLEDVDASTGAKIGAGLSAAVILASMVADIPGSGKLMPKRFHGGPHCEMKKPKRDRLDSHHSPADAASPLEREKGPAFQMNPEDHQKMTSTGSSDEAKAFREKQRSLIEEGKFFEAQMMDIDEARNKFGNKYDQAIQDMLDYTRSIGYGPR